MPAADTIDTGDPLPATFTYTAVLGLPPYDFSFEFVGIQNSGIVPVISGVDSNIVNFDAALARGGDWTIELRGTVTDANGDQDMDPDYYYVTVNPLVIDWDVGSLDIPGLELGATSAEQAILSVISGGAAPFTYDFQWKGGTPPEPELQIKVTNDNEVAIASGTTSAPGAYSGVITGSVTDATGQTVQLDLPVNLTILGMRGWAYAPAEIDSTANQGSASAPSTLGGGLGGIAPYSYNHIFLVDPGGGLTLEASGASGETVAVDTADASPLGNYSGTIIGTVTDSAGNSVQSLLPWELEVQPAPLTDTFFNEMQILDPEHWWRMAAAADPIPDIGNQQGSGVVRPISSVGNPGTFQVPGIDPNETNGAFAGVGTIGNYLRTPGVGGSDWVPIGGFYGTLLFVMNVPSGGGTWIWDYWDGFDEDNVSLWNWGGEQLLWFTSPPTAPDPDSTRIWNMAGGGGAPIKGSFHLFAIVKPNAGDFPELYVDGGHISTLVDNLGSSGNPGFWPSSFSPDGVNFFNRGNPNQAGSATTIDECAFWWSKKLTQEEIQTLTLSLGLPLRPDQ